MKRAVKNWLIVGILVALCVLGLVVLVKAASACQARGGMFVMVGKVPICAGGR